MKSLLANKLSKNNEVFVESTLKIGGNLYKPYHVVKNEERIFVIDVTVRIDLQNQILACFPVMRKYMKEYKQNFFICSILVFLIHTFYATK